MERRILSTLARDPFSPAGEEICKLLNMTAALQTYLPLYRDIFELVSAVFTIHITRCAGNLAQGKLEDDLESHFRNGKQPAAWETRYIKTSIVGQRLQEDAIHWLWLIEACDPCPQRDTARLVALEKPQMMARLCHFIYNFLGTKSMQEHVEE